MKPPWVWAVAAQVWRWRWCELSRSCLTSFQLGPGFTCGQPGRRQQWPPSGCCCPTPTSCSLVPVLGDSSGRAQA